MMQDIKCGLINTVVVKDISRFGRNYIETGTYELEEQVIILERKPEMYDLNDGVTKHILLFQNEIDRLILKRKLIYDVFMERNGEDGKKLRSDLDLLEDRIKFSENKKDELVHLDNKLDIED
jgi:site-specific DNA recombinase